MRWIKVRIVAKKLKEFSMKNGKKWAILISVLITGGAAISAGLGFPEVADFLKAVAGQAHLTPEATGAPVTAAQIGLLVAGGLQIYTVVAKILSDRKKAKADKEE
jgi:hypothetical protein